MRRISSKRATGSWNAEPATNCLSDFVTRTGSNEDADDRIVIVGYSYGIGPGTKVIGEHKN